MVAQLGPANELTATTLRSMMTSASEPGAGPGGNLLDLEPGRVVGLIGHPGFGLTRLGLSMLAGRAGRSPVAYLDVRGWLSPLAAWESGVEPEQLYVVRCDDPVRWGRTLMALLEGVAFIYAEVPRGVKEPQLRRIASLVRSRRAALVLRPVQGDLPGGIAYLHLRAGQVSWQGTDAGHGRLTQRSLAFTASGKATRGMTRDIELEDDGADAVRLVSGLAAAPARRAVG